MPSTDRCSERRLRQCCGSAPASKGRDGAGHSGPAGREGGAVHSSHARGLSRRACEHDRPAGQARGDRRVRVVGSCRYYPEDVERYVRGRSRGGLSMAAIGAPKKAAGSPRACEHSRDEARRSDGVLSCALCGPGRSHTTGREVQAQGRRQQSIAGEGQRTERAVHDIQRGTHDAGRWPVPERRADLCQMA